MGIHASELKVATLHPLIADMVRHVGGDRVEVVEMVTADDDLHNFEPTPERIRSIGQPDLCLASGMGLESDLDTLKNILGSDIQLIEVGARLPSLSGSCNHPDHDHHHGHDDPHWWHSIDTYRRAIVVVRDVLISVDPEGSNLYRRDALRYRRELDKLESWVRKEIAQIPAERRILATTHAAFAYFCHDYGFLAMPVQGVNREQMPDAKNLASLIKELRESNVAAIFPETSSNPKVLTVLTSDTGISLAPPLISDGATSKGYEAMVRYNVETIVNALK